MTASHSDRTQPLLYLLDIEGTTSPLSLVHGQLFPYAREHLVGFLAQHASDPDVRADLSDLAQENLLETAPHFPPFSGEAAVEAAISYLHWLMEHDRKSTALKSIQGKIWKAGYESGQLVGTVFPDVPQAFRRWTGRDNPARIAIYSSGSIEAQQLIFRHSSAGDLTPYISAWFDTRTGPKTSSESYRAIADAMSLTPGQILFVSDLPRELDAAGEAGCPVRLSKRVGNAPINSPSHYPAIHSFEEIS